MVVNVNAVNWIHRRIQIKEVVEIYHRVLIQDRACLMDLKQYVTIREDAIVVNVCAMIRIEYRANIVSVTTSHATVI